MKLLRKVINDIKIKSDFSQNLIIVGAGPSGVELACKISDLINGGAAVHLLELGKKILTRSKSFNQEQAEIALLIRGVHIHLETKVLEASASIVELETHNNGTIKNASTYSR